MGKETKQPTPIAADEYELFRQFVEDVHGTTRGNLRTEIENALRQYRNGFYGDDRLERIENDMATLKAAIVDAEADGGVRVRCPARTLSNAESTHTHRTGTAEPQAPTNSANITDKAEQAEQDELHTGEKRNGSETQDEPPHAKASRAEKAEWLADEFDDLDAFSLDDLTDRVDEVYSFGDEATARLVDATIKRVDLVPHPRVDELFVTPDERERLLEDIEQDTADEALTEFDTLDAGHPESE